MEENTQLPKEVVEQITLNAERFANSRVNGRSHLELWDAVFKAHEAGATAYATKSHRAEQENAELRRWKMEAAELLTKIHSYAHKHLEIKLGESVIDFVIARAKERDEFKSENEKLKQQATGWRPLLEDILKQDNHDIAYISEELIEKIKTFLYGE